MEGNGMGGEVREARQGKAEREGETVQGKEWREKREGYEVEKGEEMEQEVMKRNGYGI